MKLVEILARELEEWPEAVQTYAQDDDGTVGASDGNQVRDYSGKGWSSGENEWVTEAALNGEKLKLASDAKTAIITCADWEVERARIKRETKVNQKGWIRRKSKGKPQNANGMIEVLCRDGMNEIDYADNFAWSTNPLHASHIVKWRPHKAEQNAHEKAFDDCVDKCESTEPGDAEMPAAKYFDGPLQWRDRILELDAEQKAADEAHKAATEARDAERADLVAKLKAEGLALVVSQESSAPAFKDWRVGDLIEVISESDQSEAKNGMLLPIVKFDRNDADAPVKLDGGYWPGLHQLRWHSRPSR